MAVIRILIADGGMKKRQTRTIIAVTENGGMMMPDREKVIETCKKCINSGNPAMDYYFYYEVLALLKEQEAKEQCLKPKCVICPHCDNCDVDENGLLKEQEPVKPRYENFFGNKIARCGNCNGYIVRYKYCPGCGRAVKWGE